MDDGGGGRRWPVQELGFYPQSQLDLTPEPEIVATEPAVDLELGLGADRIRGTGMRVVPLPYAVSNGVPLMRRAIPNAGGQSWTIIHDPRKPAESAETVDVWTVRLARARFLCYKGDLHRLFPSLGYSAKQVVAAVYFDGVVPAASGALHTAMWGKRR